MFEVGEEIPKVYLNLELTTTITTDTSSEHGRGYFQRIIFHAEDFDKLYSYLNSTQRTYGIHSMNSIPVQSQIL